VLECGKNYNEIFLFLFLVLSIQAAVYSPGGAPVYQNPNETPKEVVVPTVVQQNHNYITQTVYGFLDFTTTIGNTVMVFSPQSAAVVTGMPTLWNLLRSFCFDFFSVGTSGFYEGFFGLFWA
jgi:hypothetical protein